MDASTLAPVGYPDLNIDGGGKAADPAEDMVYDLFRGPRCSVLEIDAQESIQRIGLGIRLRKMIIQEAHVALFLARIPADLSTDFLMISRLRPSFMGH
jgi:hypothetical protein